MSRKLAFNVALKRILEFRLNRMALCLDDIRIFVISNFKKFSLSTVVLD